MMMMMMMMIMVMMMTMIIEKLLVDFCSDSNLSLLACRTNGYVAKLHIRTLRKNWSYPRDAEAVPFDCP